MVSVHSSKTLTKAMKTMPLEEKKGVGIWFVGYNSSLKEPRAETFLYHPGPPPQGGKTHPELGPSMSIKKMLHRDACRPV